MLTGRFRIPVLFLMLAIFMATPAWAHFGMIIPNTSTAPDQKDAGITFDIAFAHPSAGNGMNMEKPKAFTVTCDGKTASLLGSLKEAKFMDHKAWTAKYDIKKPGVYIFAVTPEPYFEAAEETFIIHYSKTIIAAFGEEDGWNSALGLPVEIIPLTRPFGVFTGDVFQGVVLKNGTPLPRARVEIESLNRNPRHEGPNEYYESQVVTTDANGVFTAGIPWAGWWGFAALAEGDEKLESQGKKKDVELGGILWVQFAQPKTVK